MADQVAEFCGNCGTPNTSKNKFCQKCGKSLIDNTGTSPQPPATQPVPIQQPAQPSRYTQTVVSGSNLDGHTEEISNKTTEEVSNHDPKFSFWNLPNLTIIFVTLFTLLEIYYAFQAPLNFIRVIIGIGMGYWCGSYAAKHYAPKINGSQSWAFVIGYTSGFIGYVCYWIYYKYKLNKLGSPQAQSSMPSSTSQNNEKKSGTGAIEESNFKTSEFHLESLGALTIFATILISILILFGWGIGGIWFIAIGLICGWITAKFWAPKIQGSQSWAFFISFLFPVIGLIGYWIYYRFELSNPTTHGINIWKSILTLMGLIVIIIMLIGLIVISASKPGTQQNAPSPFTPIPTHPSSSYSTYENKTLGFKISVPFSWNYQIVTRPGGIPSTFFSSPDGASMMMVDVAELSSEYRSSSLDDLTNIVASQMTDSSQTTTQKVQMISNKQTVLSGNNARELTYIVTENNGKTAKWIMKLTKNGNKVYSVNFGSSNEYFDSPSNVQEIIFLFDSFILETPQLSPVQTQSTPTYLQGSESNNPYAASGIYAQRILSCRHGDVQDWDYCAQQCRLANSLGIYCNEQSLKYDWDRNH